MRTSCRRRSEWPRDHRPAGRPGGPGPRREARDRLAPRTPARDVRGPAGAVPDPLAATPHFLTVSNLLNVLEQTALNAIVAMGMTFVIISGGIDLSVGSVLAFPASGSPSRLEHAVPAPAAIAIALAMGAGCGLLNGALITFGRLPPFIATLGMMSVARGAALMLAEGRPISGFSDGFRAHRHRARPGHPGAGAHHDRDLRCRALRADADGVRPRHLCHRRQRGSGTAVGRAGARLQDRRLRRRGPHQRRGGSGSDGAAQLGAADRRHRCTSWTRLPRP